MVDFADVKQSANKADAVVTFAAALGLGAMPAYFYPLIALIILACVAAAEWAKLAFYRKTAS